MNQNGIGSSDGRDSRPTMGSAGFFHQHQNHHHHHHQQQQQQQQHQQLLQQQSSGLARLPSVYSLTLDEFQTALGGLGKDFGSMNMDELIRSIWTAEETQAMTSVATTATPMPLVDASGSGQPLQRQGSLTLPRTLSQKTVDEVWRDLFNETCAAGVSVPTTSAAPPTSVCAGQWPASGEFQVQQRQPTLGEMTLEEFLVRAGVVREDAPQPQQQQQQQMKPLDSPPHAINTISSSAAGATRTMAPTAGSAMFYAPPADFPSNKNINSSIGLGLGLNQQINNETVPSSQLNVAAATSAADMTLNSVKVGLSQHAYSPPLQQPSNNVGFRSPTQGMAAGGMMGIATTSMVNSAILPGTVGLGTTGVTVTPIAAAAAATTSTPTKPLVPDVCPKSSAELSSISPAPYAFNMGLTKKRTGVEKVIERRQRRMIKNRESAARSRARKQAYTMELEAEVAKLKEQNQELQNKQAEMMELQKTQVMEMINRQQSSKRLRLRRAQTGPW